MLILWKERRQMNYGIMQWVILLLVLLPSLVMDIREQRICSWLVACGFVCEFIYVLHTDIIIKNTAARDMSLIWEYFLRSFPGFAILITAYLGKGCIGEGDGLITVFIGILLGFKQTIAVVMLAFVFAAVFGLIMISIKRMNGKSRMPFIPFLTMGVIACGIL